MNGSNGRLCAALAAARTSGKVSTRRADALAAHAAEAEATYAVATIRKRWARVRLTVAGPR